MIPLKWNGLRRLWLPKRGNQAMKSGCGRCISCTVHQQLLSKCLGGRAWSQAFNLAVNMDASWKAVQMNIPSYRLCTWWTCVMWWVGRERNTIKGEWALHKVPQMARITQKPVYGSMSAGVFPWDVQHCSTNIRLRGIVIKVPEGQTYWTEYLYSFVHWELKSVSHVQQTPSNYPWTVSQWLFLQANKNKCILLVNSSFCSGVYQAF